MDIKDFGVEIWMNEFETKCEFNLAETCVESLTLEQLVAFSGKNDLVLSDLMSMKMTYGEIEGSARLRDSICELYTSQKRENIVATHGTIGANALIYETLVSRGDHTISVMPTYQQHYSIPESYGADVSILRLREENGFLPDLDELSSLMRPDTKLVSINNPNNPTGSLMDETMLKGIADIASKSASYVLCDEVYRGIDQEGDGFTASIADLYDKGISTAGFSKAFSLAGLRLGWIAAPEDIIHAVSKHRDYNTISVGMIDDYFGCMALDCRDKILGRSKKITRNNLRILEKWVEQEPLISFVKPKSATIALLKYDFDVPSRDLCVDILKKTGVMFTPGSALDMEGYVRIGYANNEKILTDGLAKVSDYLASRSL